MLFRVHRGGTFYTPENTMPAFRDALEKGYDQIETDPQITLDGEIVLMHDETVNRTCRLADGSPIDRPMKVCDMTYEEISVLDAGIHKGERFRGTRVPRLCELLELLDGSDVLLSLDKKMGMHQLEPLVNEVKKYNVQTEFSCADTARIGRVLELMPNAFINYDGVNTVNALEEVSALVSRERLTVWTYLDKPNFAWLTDREKASVALSERVKRYARLGIANLTCTEDVYEAIKLGADVIEV